MRLASNFLCLPFLSDSRPLAQSARAQNCRTQSSFKAKYNLKELEGLAEKLCRDSRTAAEEIHIQEEIVSITVQNLNALRDRFQFLGDSYFKILIGVTEILEDGTIKAVVWEKMQHGRYEPKLVLLRKKVVFMRLDSSPCNFGCNLGLVILKLF